MLFVLALRLRASDATTIASMQNRPSTNFAQGWIFILFVFRNSPVFVVAPWPYSVDGGPFAEPSTSFRSSTRWKASGPDDHDRWMGRFSPVGLRCGRGAIVSKINKTQVRSPSRLFCRCLMTAGSQFKTGRCLPATQAGAAARVSVAGCTTANDRGRNLCIRSRVLSLRSGDWRTHSGVVVRIFEMMRNSYTRHREASREQRGKQSGLSP